MATIIVHGVVTITVTAKTQGTQLTDDGTMALPLTVAGLLAQATPALRLEALRQLHELAWYSRHAGGVYIASSDVTILDGLYTMSLESATNQSAFPQVSLTLRRLGGGPLGGNITQQLRAQSTLQTNNYSITSTPRIAGPVGATALNMAASSTRASADGSVSVYSDSPLYAFTGADYNKGEVKVWDRAGDTGTDSSLWKRVFSPDHTFAIPSDLVIENGLLRIIGITGGNNGSHRYFAWTGAAWTEVGSSTTGDSVYIVNALVTTAYTSIVVEELSPWRIKVVFRGAWGAAPTGIKKTITLERGKPLARVELTVLVGTTLQLGLRAAGRWVLTKGVPTSGGDMVNAAFDDTEEAGNRDFTTTVEDNWAAMFTTLSSSTGTIGIVAWLLNTMEYFALEGGGFFVQDTSVTSLVAYIGGVKYDTSSAQLEAEAGTLSSGAVTSNTLAGASGSGNDQVSLPNAAARVEFATNLASIGGSTILALFRIAVSSLVSDGNVTLAIRNSTSATDIATLTRDDLEFAAANTWYWQAVVATGWNGTDTIVLRATSNGAVAVIYVDQAIVIAIAGSTTLMQIDDIAAQALTETRALPITVQQVH